MKDRKRRKIRPKAAIKFDILPLFGQENFNFIREKSGINHGIFCLWKPCCTSVNVSKINCFLTVPAAGFTQRATIDPELNEIRVLSVSCLIH